MKEQHFHLDWAWISLQNQNYVVDEQAGVLEVVLRRRGYLGETSFVGESVVNISIGMVLLHTEDIWV